MKALLVTPTIAINLERGQILLFLSFAEAFFRVLFVLSYSTEVCEALVCLVSKGIAFAKNQVRNAATKFEKTTKGVSWTDDPKEILEDAIEEKESDNETDEEEVFRNEINADVHESDIRIPIHILHAGVVVWDFPKEISQSTLDGRTSHLDIKLRKRYTTNHVNPGFHLRRICFKVGKTGLLNIKLRKRYMTNHVNPGFHLRRIRVSK